MKCSIYLKWCNHDRWMLTFSTVVIFYMPLLSCKKFIDITPPINSTNAAVVYEDAQRAAAVLTGIYTNMSRSDFSGGGFISTSLFLGLSADELTLFDLNYSDMVSYYRNQLSNLNSSSVDFWWTIYPIIYIANDAIEGLIRSTKLKVDAKQQLIGEAKFIRAFCYFYLVNLYGDVPLALSKDYKVNALLYRSPKKDVYEQIINDLKDAQSLLSDKYIKADAVTPYSSGAEERVRPSKWAATALLARTYLYVEDWINAEAQASTLLSNSTLFGLEMLNDVFMKNSKEAIWQLQPVGTETSSNTPEGRLFIIPFSGPDSNFPVYLSSDIVKAFQKNDQRAVLGNWVGRVIYKASQIQDDTVYFPYKYKIGATNTSTQEYSMVLRLGEQFLIRAEARAQQNNISGAQADLNVIRTRAGLGSTSANDKTSLLAAVQQERRLELFTEWGHRWFDLKRTNTIDDIMTPICLQKGGAWNSNWSLYPIILSELEKNPNLKQNQGY